MLDLCIFKFKIIKTHDQRSSLQNKTLFMNLWVKFLQFHNLIFITNSQNVCTLKIIHLYDIQHCKTVTSSQSVP